jgi:hypothetical protein
MTIETLRDMTKSFFNAGATACISDDTGVIAEGVNDADTAVKIMTTCDGFTTATFTNNQFMTLRKSGCELKLCGGISSLDR